MFATLFLMVPCFSMCAVMAVFALSACLSDLANTLSPETATEVTTEAEPFPLVTKVAAQVTYHVVSTVLEVISPMPIYQVRGDTRPHEYY